MPRLLAAVPVLLVLGAAVYPRLTFDREGWLADYAFLKSHMGVAYANLDWMRERRGIDTRELDRRTTEALRPARTDRQARKAIQAFVAAFDDPHLSVERHPPGWWVRLSGMWRDEGALRITRDATGDEACGALGYSDIDPGFGLEVEALPAWRPVVGPPFPAGTFRLPDGRVAGLLRVAEFGERKYRGVCVGAWDAGRRAFAAARDADRGAFAAPCGPACQDSFRSAVLDSLTARVAASASALRGAGAAVLVLDLTGNGGARSGRWRSPRSWPIVRCDPARSGSSSTPTGSIA